MRLDGCRFYLLHDGPVMIIVEGCDGSGKTTLIEKLVAATGLEVAPRVVSKDAEAMVDLVKWTEDNVAQGFQATIFDRHRLISEPIYGPILREKMSPEFHAPEWFFTQLGGLYGCNPIIIYCLPRLSQVMSNILSSDDNRIFHDNLQAVQAIWGAYFNKAATEALLRNNTFVYNYQDQVDNDLVLPYVIARIKERIRHV